MDALKKLQQEQQKQLKTLSSIPGHTGTSGLHPLIGSTPSWTSSSATSEKEQQQQLLNVDSLRGDEKPSITVGDILSGKVDPESVDMNELTEKRTAAKKENEQTVKKPIRQKIVLDGIDLEKTPLTRTSSASSLPSKPESTTVRSNRETGWTMSEEDKKKANKWGINIDKLL